MSKKVEIPHMKGKRIARNVWLGLILIGLALLMTLRDVIVLVIVMLQEPLQFIDLQEFAGFTGSPLSIGVAGAIAIGVGLRCVITVKSQMFKLQETGYHTEPCVPSSNIKENENENKSVGSSKNPRDTSRGARMGAGNKKR